MKKIKKDSFNQLKINIEKLKELFPTCITDNKIDFDNLRLILGDNLEENQEKYSFNWIGKNETIKGAQTPTTSTLRPCKEESVDFDKTENLYIEGDNLEVLKTLQKSYFGKIKLIYIDPPYNTGKDFVYKDNFKESIKNYKEQSNQSQKTNADTSGRYHTNWLNMMYSRLMICRTLLDSGGGYIHKH